MTALWAITLWIKSLMHYLNGAALNLEIDMYILPVSRLNLEQLLYLPSFLRVNVGRMLYCSVTWDFNQLFKLLFLSRWDAGLQCKYRGLHWIACLNFRLQFILNWFQNQESVQESLGFEPWMWITPRHFVHPCFLGNECYLDQRWIWFKFLKWKQHV